MDECKLSAANGELGVPCGRETCIFWRVAGHLDLGHEIEQDGCAIQKFELLEARGPEFAQWLLSVKARIEAMDPPGRS